MDKFYHFTSGYNFYSIMKYGLIPQNGFRCYSIQDSSSGVFLSKGIDNSILMYAHMLGYYEKCIGPEGDEAIQENMDKIYELSKKQHYINEIGIKNCWDNIHRINAIRNYKSFIEYLNGYCCLLSIEGLNNFIEERQEDYCYNGIIPPYNIKLVNLRDKRTNYHICYLDAILSYYMYSFSPEDFKDETNDIFKLYNYRNESWCTQFTPNDYDIVEIPIQNCDYAYQKIKY